MADEPLLKPVALTVNREEAATLLRGLRALPEGEPGKNEPGKNNIITQRLCRDLETIIQLWDRVIKGQKAAHEIRKAKSGLREQKATVLPPTSSPRLP